MSWFGVKVGRLVSSVGDIECDNSGPRGVHDNPVGGLVIFGDHFVRAVFKAVYVGGWG